MREQGASEQRPAHPVLTDELLALALGPEPRPDLEARAPRCFHHPLLERLVRAHPATPYLLYLPAIAACLWHDFHPTALLTGWLLWTFVEYWLHRGFFHMAADTPARRVTSFIVHRHHHVAPADREHLVATPLYSLGLFLLILAAATPLGPARWSLLAGSMLGYLAYEAAHWHIHHGTRRGPLARALRRHHLRHHLADPAHNFGISSPLWDLVFRTYSKRHAPEDMPDRPCPP
jgi:hypothetical protein